MTKLLALLRVAAAAAVAAIVVLLLKWAGPDAEVALWPVVRRQGVRDVVRLESGRLACWTVTFDKVRPAEVVDAGWTIRAGASVYPFQRIRRADLDTGSGDAIATRPVGPGQSSRRCAEVPEALAGVPLRITGFMEWRSPLTGWLWTVRQASPEVEVP